MHNLTTLPLTLTLPTKAETKYCIYLQEWGILPDIITDLANSVGNSFSSVAVIADPTVWQLHGDRFAQITKNLPLNKQNPDPILLPGGEAGKNLSTIQDIYQQLAARHLDRRSLILALGGGVATDTAGFVAATWMRGIRWIAMPTSLLAIVDASVGGKTAVDLDCGKNLVGAFHNPSAVIIDISCLKTLPSRQLSCGLAEMIKLGVGLDVTYLNELSQILTNSKQSRDLGNQEIKLDNFEINTFTALVRTAIQHKITIVQQDPEERLGQRALLNLGHTVGHALEILLDFQLLHGEAVSLGLIAAMLIAEKMLGFSVESTAKVRQLLQAANLPVTTHGFSSAAALELMRQDKKTEQAELRFVLPDRLGASAVYKVEPELVLSVLSQIGGQSSNKS